MRERPRVLILSDETDYHACAVRWGLARLGIACDLWDRSLFPADDRSQLYLSNDSERIVSSTSGVTLDSNAYSSIWNRRGGHPATHRELHASDRKVAVAESRRVIGGAVAAIEKRNPHALLVNGSLPKVAADYKIKQLLAAKSCGFNIPETLVSNDPSAIRRFYDRNGGAVIGKLHFPYTWRTTDGRLKYTYTTSISENMLADERAMVACPVIYQAALTVESEVRLIACGNTYTAYETARTSGAGAVDGRLDARRNKLAGRQVDVPQDLAERCGRYLDEMGLAYAAFDFGRVQGKLYFFEANESGQFLYLEHRAPGIPMLDMFCRFLGAGTADFRYEPGPDPVRLREYDASEESKLLAALWQRRSAGLEPTPNELAE